LPLAPDGKGAFFKLIRRIDGSTTWTWDYDSGLIDNLSTFMNVHEAITKLEMELGLPLTWPDLHPDAKRKFAEAEPEREAEQAQRDKEIAKNPDWESRYDRAALVRVWAANGTEVSPEELIVGEYYHVGFDIGIYRRKFQGHQWDGYPEFSDDPGDFDTWFVFENAEGEGNGDGVRIQASDWGVKTLAATDEEVKRMFQILRANHKPWVPPEKKYF
jgi:hypothetical protein